MKNDEEQKFNQFSPIPHESNKIVISREVWEKLTNKSPEELENEHREFIKACRRLKQVDHVKINRHCDYEPQGMEKK